MPTLSPGDAAYAAANVYNIISDTDVTGFGLRLQDKFDIQAQSRFEGVAGASIFKYQSGFGLIAPGVGAYEGDTLLAIRGTEDKFRDLILTDGNIAVRPTASGGFVHAGFQAVFDSFTSDLESYFRDNSPNRVHCLGHSLGGGLATLAADWIAARGLAQPELYTFGSPRVGTSGFTKQLTDALGADNIYRVNHSTDVVSMVPLWPFIHVPDPGLDCHLDVGSGAPGIEFHLMGKYFDSVEGKTWGALRTRRPPTEMEQQIETWISSDSALSFTTSTLDLINKSIAWVIKKALHLTGVTIQLALTTGLTLLDQLSMLIHRAAQASKELGEIVGALVSKILRLTGQRIVQGVNLTVSFLRWVLSTLTRTVYQLAMRAVSLAHLGG